MSDRKIKVACVQLRCSDDVAENVRTASALIRDAHKMGAQFIGTPENTGLMAADGGAKLEKTVPEQDDKALPQFVRRSSIVSSGLKTRSLRQQQGDYWRACAANVASNI